MTHAQSTHYVVKVRPSSWVQAYTHTHTQRHTAHAIAPSTQMRQSKWQKQQQNDDENIVFCEKLLDPEEKTHHRQK